MDKQALIGRQLPEEDLEIPGAGSVRVRGLSRKEVLELRQMKGDFELNMISFAMVDPALTPDEVAEWQGAAPNGELEAVTDLIGRLSGVGKGADKSGVSGTGG